MSGRDTHTEDKTMKFVKMQGLGNDYIYFDIRHIPFDFSGISSLVERLSDRHFGIGGDGVVFICSSDRADASMRMFNADGSEGKMCGNAVRCIAKYLYDDGLKRDVIYVDTASGIKRLKLNLSDGGVKSVTADMGVPSFNPQDIGLNGTKPLINHLLSFPDGESVSVTCVSMGNPHCVVFVDSLADIEKYASRLSEQPIFTQGINVEFVKIEERGLLMRVFERGSGETLACGTGACASAVAAHVLGYVDVSTGIDVIMSGGILGVEYDNFSVKATGPAEEVFRGEIIL